MQLLFGKFYSSFSIKRVYLVAIGLFELGSLLCGVASNSLTLIIGRAIAGFGSAAIFSGALIILAHSVALESRPMYTGMVGSMYGIASVAGPLLGGVFTDKMTWRWCFLINLPIGITTMVIIACFLPPLRPATTIEKKEHRLLIEKIKEFDPIGTVLFMPSIICLLLALQWGGTTYAWHDARIIALFALFGVLFAAFSFVQYRLPANMATVPIHIIRKRTVWASVLFIFAAGAAFTSCLYFLPIWFQAVKGVSAVSSGLMNLPMLISLVLMSLVAGIAVTVFGHYAPFMIAATVLMSVGYGLIATFTPDTKPAMWIGYQVLAGAGMGLGTQQPLMAVQTVLETADIPIGTSVIIFIQTLGGALFVSITENVFTNKLVEYILQRIPGLDPEVVLAVGVTNIDSVVPAAMLPAVKLAYNDALRQAFLISTVMAAATVVGSALVEWRSVKEKKTEQGPA